MAKRRPARQAKKFKNDIAVLFLDMQRAKTVLFTRGLIGAVEQVKQRRQAACADFGEEQMRSLGRRLRELRDARSWSLKRIAVESGVSVAAIQKIEAGDTNPSLLTVLSLAEALGEPVDRLVASSRAASSAITVTRGALPGASADLATDLAQRRMDARLMVLPARRAVEGEGAAGPMFYYLLDGEVRFGFADGATDVLRTGDALHMVTGQAPRCVNLLSRPSRILCIIDQRELAERQPEFA